MAEREEENENEEENEEGKSKKEEKNNKDLLSSPEDVENKLPEGALDLNYNLNEKNNLSDEAPIMNVSHISELSQDKSKKIKKDEIQKSSENKDKKLIH